MGRTFQESFPVELRGLEVGVDGMNEKTQDRELLRRSLRARPERIWYVGDAFAQACRSTRCSSSREDRPLVPGADRADVKTESTWTALRRLRRRRAGRALDTRGELRALKQKGFSDRRSAKLLHTSGEGSTRRATRALNVRPVYISVDTCAAECSANQRLYVFHLR